MRVFIGSGATKKQLPAFREPKDLDYFTDEKIPKDLNGRRIETFYHPDLELWDWSHNVPSHTVEGFPVNEKVGMATVDELYTLKVSHMFWSNNWVKHAKDVIWFQNNSDAKFLPELFAILYKIWVQHYGAKRASLPKGTKAKDFFRPSVDRRFDHDSIHASIAYGDRPLFNEVLQDGEDVAVSWEKFEALPHETKLQLVREEIYATALERQIIPADYMKSSTVAYRWALEKTVTSFWKGRWALWVVLHLNELVSPDVDYVKRHHENSERLVLL